MTKRKKITISVIFSFIFVVIAYVTGTLGWLFILLHYEHALIGEFLYSLGIGSKKTTQGVIFGIDYPLGWFLTLLSNYVLLTALTFLILTVVDKRRVKIEHK